MLSAGKNERLNRVGRGTRMFEPRYGCRSRRLERPGTADPPQPRPRGCSSPGRRSGTGMDVIRFRPACGASPEFVQENRVAAGRHAGCRCAACGLTCTVGLGTLVGALVGTEPGQ